MSDYKPSGHPDVSPYLVCAEAEKLADFLCSVFDGSIVRRFDHPDGGWMHGEVKVGNGVVMIGQPQRAFQPVTGYIHVYVPDAELVQSNALKQGAKAMMPVSQQEGDPDRRGGFVDPWGNTWFPATQAENR